MSCGGCDGRQRLASIFIFAVFLLAGGIAFLVLWPNMAEHIKINKLIVREGSEAYENWREVPIPIYLEFYLFNWTNVHELRTPGVKPKFVEMGPYVYIEKRFKENITFHENSTVSYYQKRVWYFDAKRSNGTEDDLVTAGHAITATVADMMRHKNKWEKKVINFLLNNEGGKLATTKTVREWIFHGYEDRLIDFLNLFNSTKIKVPYTRFAWMADRNNSLTYDGLFTIFTGAQDLHSLGSLEHWNGRSESGFYQTPCGAINGSTGDLFPPHMDTKAELTIFATDACRFLNLVPNGTLERHGLKGAMWEGTKETLDSGENYASEKCFCNRDIVDKCPLTGVFECKKCRNNAPIYASFPHFYLADPSYVEGMEGLNPQADLHKFTLAVEPNLGIPLEVHARLQINMMIQPDNDFDIYRGIPPLLMPMFWFEQKAELNEELASRAKLALNLESYGRYFAISLILGGTIVILIGIAMSLKKHWRSQSEDEDEDMLTTENAALSPSDPGLTNPIYS